MLRGVVNDAEPVHALGRLRAALSAPLVAEDLPLAVETSVSYVLAPEDGTDRDLLATKADVAMCAAKRCHLGVSRHSPGHEQYDTGTLRLVGDLAAANESD